MPRKREVGQVMAEAPDSHQFITDISGRIIELAMGDEEGRVYIAYALAGVLDDLAAVDPEAPEREFAEVLNMQILKALTYAQLVRVASPEDIEAEINDLGLESAEARTLPAESEDWPGLRRSSMNGVTT